MKKPISSFSILFQANSLFPKLVILVGFYSEKVENLEDLFLFCLYFFEFTRFIHTLVDSSHRNKSFLTVFWISLEHLVFFQSISIDFNSFLIFLFLGNSIGNFIPYWNKGEFTLFPDYVTKNGIIPTLFPPGME